MGKVKKLVPKPPKIYEPKKGSFGSVSAPDAEERKRLAEVFKKMRKSNGR